MLIACAAYQDGDKLADGPIDAIGRLVGQPEGFVRWRFRLAKWL